VPQAITSARVKWPIFSHQSNNLPDPCPSTCPALAASCTPHVPVRASGARQAPLPPVLRARVLERITVPASFPIALSCHGRHSGAAVTTGDHRLQRRGKRGRPSLGAEKISAAPRTMNFPSLTVPAIFNADIYPSRAEPAPIKSHPGPAAAFGCPAVQSFLLTEQMPPPRPLPCACSGNR
jgi:hypothetical protein